MMMDYPKSDLVTLKEALDLTGCSIVPGALNVNGKELVRYDEENDSYTYIPDIDAKTLHYQDHIGESQLEQEVPNATDRRWIPTSNFVIM